MKTVNLFLLGVVAGMCVAAWALFLASCSGDIEVHGVPKKIELEAPFCAPAPADAGDAS